MSEDLLNLLAEEEAALRRADVRRAISLQDEKAALLDRFVTNGQPTETALARVRAASLRNERLLGLALEGCQQALSRMSAARARASRIGYDAGGAAVSHTDGAKSRRV